MTGPTATMGACAMLLTPTRTLMLMLMLTLTPTSPPGSKKKAEAEMKMRMKMEMETEMEMKTETPPPDPRSAIPGPSPARRSPHTQPSILVRTTIGSRPPLASSRERERGSLAYASGFLFMGPARRRREARSAICLAFLLSRGWPPVFGAALRFFPSPFLRARVPPVSTTDPGCCPCGPVQGRSGRLHRNPWGDVRTGGLSGPYRGEVLTSGRGGPGGAARTLARPRSTIP